MNRKGQTEDVFADLIPSIILIVIGVLVMYYFTFNYYEEVGDNEFIITRIADRETFSLEGLMEHNIDVKGVKYTTIELIDRYANENRPAEKEYYEELVIGSANDYLAKVNPQIAACFRITLDIPLQKQVNLIDMCEMKYAAVDTIKTEDEIIPLKEGGYARIKIEHGEPLL